MKSAISSMTTATAWSTRMTQASLQTQTLMVARRHKEIPVVRRRLLVAYQAHVYAVRSKFVMVSTTIAMAKWMMLTQIRCLQLEKPVAFLVPTMGLAYFQNAAAWPTACAMALTTIAMALLTMVAWLPRRPILGQVAALVLTTMAMA